MKKIIMIEGMSCEHCVNHVKEALAELNGVSSVDVNLTSRKAVLEASEDINDEAIKAAIDDAGYEVIKIEVL